MNELEISLRNWLVIIILEVYSSDTLFRVVLGIMCSECRGIDRSADNIV